MSVLFQPSLVVRSAERHCPDGRGDIATVRAPVHEDNARRGSRKGLRRDRRRP
jgi:hypothetical protein